VKKLLLLILVVSLLTIPSLSVGAQDDRPDLLIWADSTRAPALQGIVEAFSAEYGINAEVQEIAMGDIRANLTIAGPAGEGPDILVGAHDWLGEFIQNGAIVPVELGDVADQFAQGALDTFTVDGVLYGMPYTVENLAFFRNTDYVPDAPETWDDVFTITDELISNGELEYGYVISSTASYEFFPIMTAFGGYVFGQDVNGNYNPGDIGIGSTETIAASAYIKQYADAGYLNADINGDVAITLFESGEAAMILTGPWWLNRLRTSGVPFAISDIPAGPAGPGYPYLGGQGFMISAFSENQLLAQIFLSEFMATPDSMLAFYDELLFAPSYLPVLELIEDDAIVAFQQAGENGIPQPAIPEMTTVWGSWGNAFQFVVTGELEPEDAYIQAQDQIVEAIGLLGAAPNSVELVGTVQTFFGCESDWDPACENVQMFGSDDGTYTLTTAALPAGDYEVKVTFNGSWDVNYGTGGTPGGDNIAFTVDTDGALVVFSFNTADNTLSVAEGSVAVVGTVQTFLGCAGDWSPHCSESELQANGDGTFSLTTDAIPAGEYEFKVAVNDGWAINYGVDGTRNGDNLALSVTEDGSAVTFTFDGAANVVSATVGS
jgi:arabinogalactan oligomer/maltooligosaccharide transport system substrate-binding protein